MRDESQMFDYQRKMINHQCTHPQSMMWADMGLGKSVVTLSSVKYLIHEVKFLRPHNRYLSHSSCY